MLISKLRTKQEEECDEECPEGSPAECAKDCLGNDLMMLEEIMKKLFQDETMENILKVTKDCQKACEGEDCHEEVQGCVDKIPGYIETDFPGERSSGSGSGGEA